MARKVAKVATPKKVGRPKKEIDWVNVKRLLSYNCSGVEVASTLGISPDTLYRRAEIDFGCTFSAVSQSALEKGNTELKQRQHEVALSGNPTMLIWLGKQRLGQIDAQIASDKPPKEELIEKDQKIMILSNEIAKLREDANKCQAGS